MSYHNLSQNEYSAVVAEPGYTFSNVLQSNTKILQNNNCNFINWKIIKIKVLIKENRNDKSRWKQ